MLDVRHFGKLYIDSTFSTFSTSPGGADDFGASYAAPWRRSEYKKGTPKPGAEIFSAQKKLKGAPPPLRAAIHQGAPSTFFGFIWITPPIWITPITHQGADTYIKYRLPQNALCATKKAGLRYSSQATAIKPFSNKR
jgi:hypothetical protein